MKRATLDTITGVFVFIGLIFLAWCSINLGKMEFFGSGYYLVYAEFDSAAGLKKGAVVEIAGVDVGKVDGMTLNQRGEMARVSLKIRNGVKLQDDVVASIRTTGIIGDKIISIYPGGSNRNIPPGGMIEDTESSVDFENLISQFVQGKD